MDPLPSPDERLRAEILAYYEAVVRAFAAADAGALARLFDEAIAAPMTREQIRAWGEGFFREHGAARFLVERVEIERADAAGAVVLLAYRVETAGGGGSFGGLERDVRARRGAGWTMTAWEALPPPGAP